MKINKTFVIWFKFISFPFLYNTWENINIFLRFQVDAVTLRKRQEYLRTQRDKLVALKKEARRKQLGVSNDFNGKASGRPKSAKAAQDVLTGTDLKIEPQQLQIRRTLAERLRSEVVEKERK